VDTLSDSNYNIVNVVDEPRQAFSQSLIDYDDTENFIDSRVNTKQRRSLPPQSYSFSKSLQPSFSLDQKRLLENSPTTFLRRERVLVGTETFLNARSRFSRLRPFCESAIQLEYSLDNGIPYPRDGGLGEVPVKVLVVDETPTLRFDPEKPLRAAAFTGWVITQGLSSKDIEEYTVFLEETIERAVDES